MIKADEKVLQLAVLNAKKIYQEHRDRETLLNYINIRKMVNKYHELAAEIKEANKVLYRVKDDVQDWNYLFRYFNKYLGKEKYNNMLYHAYVGLLSQEGVEKHDDLQRIARKINRV